MTSATIRRANVDDIEAIAVLFDGYRRFYEQPGDLEGARRFLKARLNAQDSVILLAERDKQPLGFTQLYPSFSSVSMRRLWILNDLFVDPRQRGGGVGHALMNPLTMFRRVPHGTGRTNPPSALPSAERRAPFWSAQRRQAGTHRASAPHTRSASQAVPTDSAIARSRDVSASGSPDA